MQATILLRRLSCREQLFGRDQNDCQDHAEQSGNEKQAGRNFARRAEFSATDETCRRPMVDRQAATVRTLDRHYGTPLSPMVDNYSEKEDAKGRV